MIRVVLTSFEPFDRHSVNSSLEVGRALFRQPPPGVDLDWVVLPVVAGACVEQAWNQIVQTDPALVLSLGQASGAAGIRLERIAVNINDFRIPDNAGNVLRQQSILAAGPPAYRTTAPVQTMAGELNYWNIPAELSDSAGTFVCNHLFYSLLHRAALSRATHQTAFIHLPLLPGQVSRHEPQPPQSLDQLAEGIRLAIATSLEATRAIASRR